MLGISGMLVNSGDGGADATEDESGARGGGGVGPSSGGFNEEEKINMEEIDRNSGGNRWPRQETVALLQVRSDMDVAFRDSSLKGPLWEEVSRKLGELGYHRSAKKCKEKFENVYKYHRRTKEGRSTKPEGKTYRFFDQLEAFENQTPPGLPRPLPPQQQARHQSQPFTSATPMAVSMPEIPHPPVSTPQFITVPSVQNLNPIMVSQDPSPPNQLQLSSFPPPLMTTPMNFSYQTEIPPSHHEIPGDMAFSTSSSTSSDQEREERGKRKRKWGHFFQRLMSEVIEKQEEMQRKFLDTLERRECERVAREEAWRAQEMARMNREHELFVHERSVAAAKDAAVIQFLQKISDQQCPNDPTPTPTPTPVPPPNKQTQPPCPPVQHPQGLPQPVLPPPPTQPPGHQVQHPQALPQPLHPPPPPPEHSPNVRTPTKALEIPKMDNGGGESFNPTTSSRWPKAEIEALIRIRTNMDTKYQENVPKGPLWEEISAAMRKIGYDRNAKRCKEKWENINKYFKKVKDSNKKRPNDSKTCPYFQQLDVLYKEKAKNENSNTYFNPSVFGVNLENIRSAPMIVQPERQYQSDTAMEDDDSQNIEDEEAENEDDEEVSVYDVVSNPVGPKME